MKGDPKIRVEKYFSQDQVISQSPVGRVELQEALWVSIAVDDNAPRFQMTPLNVQVRLDVECDYLPETKVWPGPSMNRCHTPLTRIDQK